MFDYYIETDSLSIRLSEEGGSYLEEKRLVKLAFEQVLTGKHKQLDSIL